MEPFAINRLGRFPMVELATRYFTSRRDDPTGVPLDFDRTIDPNGILASMVNGKYFHGEDNRVEYFIMERSDNEDPPRQVLSPCLQIMRGH